MCLKVASALHPRLMPRRATCPLIVRKDLNKGKHGVYRSPTYPTYVPGSGGYWKSGVMNSVKTLTKGGRLRFIDKGLHSALPSRYEVAEVRLWAVIPKGATFFIGTNNDLVSDKLIVFESIHAMKKYLGISGPLPQNVHRADVDSYSVLIDKKK